MLREKATSSIVALAVAFGVTLVAPAAWAQQAGDQQYQPPPPYQGQPYQGQPYQPPAQPYPPQPPQYQPPQYQPQPQYVQPQYVYAPPPRVVYRPYYFRPQVGLGLRLSGMWSDNDWTGFGQYGIGGELLGRVAPRLALELAIQYQGTTNGGANDLAGYYNRWDVPVTLGLRIYLGSLRWVVSPYLVLAAGGDYAKAQTVDGAGALLSDTAGFFEGQFGGGLEFRIGRHFAITLDVRGTGRVRLDNPGTNTFGYDFMGNQGSVQFNGGLAGYL